MADPVADGDARLDAAEARFAALTGAINVAMAEVVALVAEAVANEATLGATGARSVEQWVCFQTGVSPAHAKRLVTIARRRMELPECWGLFEAGLITPDAMYAIARRVPACRDSEVAELAPRLLYTQLVHWLGSIPEPVHPPAPTSPDDPALEPGVVSFWFDDHGRLRLRGDLPADDGAVFEKSLRSARDDLFHLRHPDAADTASPGSVTWADALTHLAELGLASLDGSLCGRRPGERYQTLIHLDSATGAGRWHMGDLIPDAVRRYLTCDSDRRIVFTDHGVPVGFSRRSRTVDDKTRALIEHRDRGCRVPSCDQRRWLHIHHIIHWEQGGFTEPANLCALCPVHHRMHHTGLLHIDGDPTTPHGLHFRDRWGNIIAPNPPRPPAKPPDPPDPPYRHPIGERAHWQWITWRTDDDERPSRN